MDGKMGYCTDWYRLLCLADRLHCAPWELLEQSIYWRTIAAKAITAENQAMKIKEQHRR
jgi:hypothetical protein